MTSNDDIYRETIDPEDLGQDMFQVSPPANQEEEKKQKSPAVEKELEKQFIENIPKKEEKKEEKNIITHKIEEEKPIESEDRAGEQVPPIMEIKAKEEVPEIEHISLKEEASIEEIKLPSEEVEEIKPKEVVIEEKPQQDFTSIYNELWAKVNPSVIKESENKKELTDIAVKLTLLKEDLEDGEIKEEEALMQIREIQQKI